MHVNRWDYIYRFSQEGKLVEDKRLSLYFENDSLKRIDDAAPSVSTAKPVDTVQSVK
jgi:outer membrane protein assembly factor BamE